MAVGSLYFCWETESQFTVSYQNSSFDHEKSSCLIRTFLQAGKHVCVEYPMTINYRAAVELWDIAQQKGDTHL